MFNSSRLALLFSVGIIIRDAEHVQITTLAPFYRLSMWKLGDKHAQSGLNFLPWDGNPCRGWTVQSLEAHWEPFAQFCRVPHSLRQNQCSLLECLCTSVQNRLRKNLSSDPVVEFEWIYFRVVSELDISLIFSLKSDHKGLFYSLTAVFGNCYEKEMKHCSFTHQLTVLLNLAHMTLE